MKKHLKNAQSSDSKQGTETQLPLRIGDLLIKEGLLKREDVEKALSIQRQEAEMRELPLGQILVKMGVLSKSSIEELLNHPDLRKKIGISAVEKGLINKSQLEFCLRKKKPHQLIGEVLTEEGLLTPDDLGRLLKEQTSSPMLGELAVRLRLISETDLEAALRIQKSYRALGEILCDLNLVSPLDLNYVLNKYNKRMGIGRILLTLGYINKEQFSIARQEKNLSTDSLGEILVRKNFITQEQLLHAQSKQFNIPFKDLEGFAYSESEKKLFASIISQKYAENNLILPISLKGNHLTLAVFRPNDIRLGHELKGMYSHFSISCVLITKEKFEELFEVLYSERLSTTASSDRGQIVAHEVQPDFMELDLNEEIERTAKDTPIYGARDVEAEELVNFIIKYGIINGASDIHIEQDRKGVKLRYRLDGVLREATIGWLKDKLREKVAAVVSRIKIMANLDIAEKRLPQDGVFRIHYYDKASSKRVDLDFRVATCRAIVGENVTIRILDPRKANVGLDNLSHSPHVLEPLKRLLKSSAGMILVCGPTGSGKSSTLYAALQHVYNPGMKIITAEDPIEYSFPGIMQTQIHPKINLTFARLLRSFLRLDPDVILVGEMRDEETARIGFDAAQTGHLLLSTLHTNDAVGAVSRLLDLNVEYGQIASCLMCVLAQRLVRRICLSCIQEYVPDDDEWGIFFKNYPSHLKFFRGQGCEACDFTGYKGRTLLSEIFVVDKRISQAFTKGLDEEGIRNLAIESGMKTMLDDGLLKLKETTLTEIIRMVPHDMIKAFRSRSDVQDTADSLTGGMSGGGGASKQDDVSPASVHVSNPETQTAMIDLLQAKYEALKAENGDTSSSVDPILFREFIADSFYLVREKHRCKGVTFNIENKGGDTCISAIPSQ